MNILLKWLLKLSLYWILNPNVTIKMIDCLKDSLFIRKMDYNNNPFY